MENTFISGSIKVVAYEVPPGSLCIAHSSCHYHINAECLQLNIITSLQTFFFLQLKALMK